MTYDTSSKSVVEDYTSSTVKQFPDETLFPEAKKELSSALGFLPLDVVITGFIY